MSIEDCEFPKLTFEEALALSKLYKTYEEYHNCKMFNGGCIKNNRCPCLLSLRGGFCCWGECVHIG